MNNRNYNVCDQIIRNYFNEDGLHGTVLRKKPFISKRNKSKLFKCAKQHMNNPISYSRPYYGLMRANLTNSMTIFLGLAKCL